MTTRHDQARADAALGRRECLAFLAACGLAGPAAAQSSFPDQPIRLVIPFPSGGILDVMARMLGRRLATALGQPVIVDNKPGAGGNIGTEFVVRSKPDGSNLVISGASLVSTVLLQPNLSFNPMKDLAPVAMLATTPGSIVAYPGAPFKTIQEMVAYAKANPGKLSFATAGNGSLGHMLGAWLNAVAGIDLLHVPYRGGAAASIDVIAGRVPLWFDVAANREMTLAGKVRALAVTSKQRTPVLPNVPTLIESGYNVDGYTWWALMAPAETPRTIVDRISSEMAKIIAAPAAREELVRLGVDPEYRPPAELTAFMRTEYDKWGKVIRDAGIKSNE
ncbi:Bug family tripartite tricarboxylate transporter substrate binding protein [Caenimonas aquaedulcis]|uniref:Tripartite tricarboxylate transporter substrate binding protein n=1 Tax=Caenimonas aquaedulcis TaxID=2793270 RepID=A0A931MFE7_9BURK|nr:tripartite tricarboxylate transporter substrate binding protein [Caenimonas aquaedulcis]MBG9386435.1 tripartite tricarboxylate transporter substrate binding protein [Caenimonas aquaedulcis]